MATSITSTKLLAVEGKDEVHFFQRLIEILGLQNIQVIDVGGKDKFREKFESLSKVSGFNKLEIIGIVRDAEQLPASSAFESIKATLKNVRLEEPDSLNNFTDSSPSVGIFIMPNNNGTGMLEDLCLSSMQGTPLMQCVDNFFGCLQETPDHISKSKVLCLLSAKTPLCNSLGIATQNSHIDLTHNSFDSIKAFLNEFA